MCEHPFQMTKAVVFACQREVAVLNLTVSDPAQGEVQVRTSHSAVSAGTEGWFLQNKVSIPFEYPMIPGYQRVGEIVAVGADVNGWEVGERVACTISSWNGSATSMWGAHVGLANTPATELYRLSESIDQIDAAAVVVAQVGYNAASRLSLARGVWILVYGDGLIAQLASQATRARGGRAILVGHREERLALAAAHAADHVIDDRDEHFLERVRAWADSDTVAGVIDTVQAEVIQKRYLPLLEPESGQVVYSGWGPARVWADMALLQQRALTTHFVTGWTRPRIDATIALMAYGKLLVRPRVTHRALPYAAPAIYAMTLTKSEPHLGVVFDWLD
jgi:3-hydroxyethyl bacteriochlorophyllide a dehydrogenase